VKITNYESSRAIFFSLQLLPFYRAKMLVREISRFLFNTEICTCTEFCVHRNDILLFCTCFLIQLNSKREACLPILNKAFDLSTVESIAVGQKPMIYSQMKM
jgi:hypothetical protein